MGVRITEICGRSGFFRAGDIITSIDGHRVDDQLDLYYLLSGTETARFSVERADGKKADRRLRVETLEQASPVFEEMRFIGCGSRCVFCFVDQMPPGMRRSLYLKDDDYRLSFLFGNYITLNDISRGQVRKIIRYGLSPMYVSVHATDGKVRERLFGRPMKRDIMSVLSELTSGGITVHAQIVVVPGINDGKILAGTVSDLFSMYPACATVAVVPVGLTAYRDGLTSLRKVSPAEAREMIDLVSGLNRRFREKTGGGDFAFMSDEFYLLAGRVFPGAEAYGGFEQLSNGVGMARMFIDGMLDRVTSLKKRKRPPAGTVNVVTGRLGGRLIRKFVLPLIRRELPELDVRILTAGNSTFGDSVTVSGLLAGADVMRAAEKRGVSDGVLVLPPNMVNHEGLLLDDTSPSSLGRKLGMKVVVPEDNFLEDRVLRAAWRARG